ncbi:hypothetical protein GH714_041894 [Hevea brasiliensis]|uniref:Uncharacterized protein n=1 Tax=Hevea brasiliensis TaxID=3981 RepID=A0A6A6MWH8_HEVBR|nr:hypothetical protein GH714_041894 [Hevea brasiliensis]
MGFSKKTQVDSGLDSEGKKWVIAGIAIRTSLKPISTKPRGKDVDDGDEEEERSTTPTAKEQEYQRDYRVRQHQGSDGLLRVAPPFFVVTKASLISKF